MLDQASKELSPVHDTYVRIPYRVAIEALYQLKRLEENIFRNRDGEGSRKGIHEDFQNCLLQETREMFWRSRSFDDIQRSFGEFRDSTYSTIGQLEKELHVLRAKLAEKTVKKEKKK